MTKLAARRVGISLFLAGLLLVSGSADADEARERADGAAVAQKLCSGCHIVAEGQRGPVADGVPPFSVIADRPGRTIGYLQGYLADPTPPMPHVPLSKREIDNVIAYIRSFAD